MKNKFFLTIWSIFILIQCTNKKCKEAKESAQTKPKDSKLMYIWRFTDNLIIRKTAHSDSDSGFVSFKPNGDYNSVPSIKYIEAGPNVWYNKNNLIVKNYCVDMVPYDDTICRYEIKNDTLFLYGSTNGKDYAVVPQTYIHFRKY